MSSLSWFQMRSIGILAAKSGPSSSVAHIGRLCDFRDRLVANCKSKRMLDKSPAEKCDLLPQQCDWCGTAPLCRSYVTGATVGCSPAEAAAHEASRSPLREKP